VRVSFWVGRREFRGQVPPARLTAWPRLRRVVEERTRTSCLSELAGDPLGGAEAVRALLQASPLTNLFTLERAEPVLEVCGGEWDSGLERGLLAALGDPAICRLVIARWLEDGVERAGAAFAAALVRRLGPRRRDLLVPTCLALCCHLHLCLL